MSFLGRLSTIGLLFLIGTLPLAAQDRMILRLRVTVPDQFKRTPFNPPPNGESEAVRYRKSYEAFWWNCLSVRAANLSAHCPLVASGTPGAAAGAGDGAANADSQINKLLNNHSAAEVGSYLRSLAATNEAKLKMKPYFHSPTPE